MIKHFNCEELSSFYLVGISELRKMFPLCMDPVRLSLPFLWCVHVTCGAAVHAHLRVNATMLGAHGWSERRQESLTNVFI